MKTIFWLLIIALIGIIVYCNSLSLVFRWDDTYQIVNAPFIHKVTNIPYIFLTSIHHVDSTNILFGYYYKPIMYSAYAVLYAIGNGHVEAFHLTQISLHIINSMLVFLIFKRFFSEKISVLLALVFLVHPINEETVVYIANLQDTLYFFFGTAAIYLILKWKQEKLGHAVIVGALLLLSCLSKEAGALYLLLAFSSILLFINKRNEKRSIGMLAIVGGIYLTLRMLASTHYFTQMEMTSASTLARLKSTPYVLGFYIREGFIPTDLITQPKHFIIPHISGQEYFISAITILVFSLFWIGLGIFIWKKNRENFKVFLFFLNMVFTWD